MILGCIHREYPNQIAHVLEGDADVRPPRELTPAFFGSYDWHSAVHGHWALARLARFFPDAGWAVDARRALGRSFTSGNLIAEAKYVGASCRTGFERPYGLAWVLQLASELREWNDGNESPWAHYLFPLEFLAVARLSEWLPKLTHPIRTGEHSQTAFAMGMALDYARTAGNSEFETLLKSRAADFYEHDHAAPLHFEPSGHDFLSPCLAEADLMRRIMEPVEFATWLEHFLPGLAEQRSGSWLVPVELGDRSDGKLAHLDGLNLSRAWMLEGIASNLLDDDPRWPLLQAAAAEHSHRGLAAVTGEHYAGGHWLGTFAVYLTTRRGIRAAESE